MEDLKNMKFQEAQDRLDGIIQKMQENETSLEDSMDLYKEALVIIDHLKKKLDEYKNEIQDFGE